MPGTSSDVSPYYHHTKQLHEKFQLRNARSPVFTQKGRSILINNLDKGRESSLQDKARRQGGRHTVPPTKAL